MPLRRLSAITLLPLLLLAQQAPAAPPLDRGRPCKTTITDTRGLQFGVLAVSAPGTANVSTAGIVTTTGGVVSLPGGFASAAAFDVSGCPDAVYTIVLPSSMELRSKNNIITVDGFVSDPNGSSTLDGNGVARMTVGARLNAGANQASGDYSGSFTIELIF